MIESAHHAQDIPTVGAILMKPKEQEEETEPEDVDRILEAAARGESLQPREIEIVM